jgi:hypothetical protein
MTRATGRRRRPFLLAATLASAAAFGTAPAALFPGRLIGAGDRPGAPVVADFNGDGVADIAVANRDSGTLSIVIGRGDGTFEGQLLVQAGPEPVLLATADFDGDGRADLAVADGKDGGIVILVGRGDGSFTPAPETFIPDEPSALVAADLNGDGRVDLAATYARTQRVVVLLGGGDGTLLALPPIVAGVTPAALAAADLDRDGRLDLVVSGRFAIAVLLGRGDGTYGAGFEGVVPTDAVSMVAADLEGDGITDVVLGGKSNGSDLPIAPAIVVLRGAGDGGFSLLQSLDVAASPLALQIADLDGDGHPDLAGARTGTDAGGRGTIAFYRSLGDGTFAAPVVTPAGFFPAGLAAADFNQDGIPDLVVTNGAVNSLSILTGIGDGGFRPRAPRPPSVAVGDAPMAIVATDLDGDGRNDLATANDFSHDLSVVLATGDGQFAAGAAYPVGLFPESLVAADLNGDGRPDLVADDHLLFGGAGGLFEAGPWLPAGYRPLALAAGDLNGDGRTDLAIADAGDFGANGGAIAIFVNGGVAGFLPAGRLEAGNAPVALTAADLDQDGHLDLVSADAFASDLRCFRGRGDGTFDAPETVTAGLYARALVMADVDRDGHPDLVASGFEAVPGGGSVSVLRGDGRGGFEAPETLVAGPSALDLAVGDLDADGDPDLAASSPGADTVAIFLNRGDGRFAPQESYFADDAPGAVAIADLDGDGRNDLAVANELIPGRVSLLLNTGPYPDRAPAAVPRVAPAVECASPQGGEVVLDGRASTDADSAPGTEDDIASFSWFEDSGTPAERLLADSALASVTLPLGRHVLTLRVTDRAGSIGAAAVTVQVVDTRPPTLALHPDPLVLWPPNHQMRPVTISVESADACGATSVTLVSVLSSEPDDAPGAGDGATRGDIADAAVGTSDRIVNLRAERDDRGPGRTYTLVYRAVDASGNSAVARATVLVPASRVADGAALRSPHRRQERH